VLTTQKVDESNKQKAISHAATDVIRHVFAFYDIQHDPEHTTMHIATENNHIQGYILSYTGADTLSVILECEAHAADKLLQHAPENHFIMHTLPELRPQISRKFGSAKFYIEDWMLLKRAEANFIRSQRVRKLTRDDAPKLAELLSSRSERPKQAQERYVSWISRLPLYGIFVNGELVSYAGSFIQLPQVWMIGGVYTHPDHRNKGYATLAVSAISEEALGNAEAAALFVRSDNHSAIRAYEKIGYRKIGEKLWVDIGTGLRP
jgi:RimJ/RimL family protein N-acetyltransferase